MRDKHSINDLFCRPAICILAPMVLLLLSCTSEPDKQYLVGTINPNPKLKPVMEHFLKAMEGHGYVEGDNITYIHAAGGDAIDASLSGFQERDVDLVLTFSTPSLKKARDALRKPGTPIVAMCYDPVEAGVVKSLIYKKENITGFQSGGSIPKALEWLLLIVPDIKRVFVPLKYDTPAAELSLLDLKRTAKKLDVEILAAEVNTTEELKAALTSMPDDIGAVFIPHSIFVVAHLDTILETCNRRKIPTAAGAGYHRQGVTITYGQDYQRTGEELALLAHKVLQGNPAFSLPFKMTDYFLAINLKSARSIGLDIPHYYVRQADIVNE